MIVAELTFIVDPSCQIRDRWRSFRATGHSGFSVKGFDIVCAAFTCLVRTTLRFGVSSGWVGCHKISESLIFFEIEKSFCCQGINVMADFLLMGLGDLQREFPENLKFEVRKVGK